MTLKLGYDMKTSKWYSQVLVNIFSDLCQFTDTIAYSKVRYLSIFKYLPKSSVLNKTL